MPRRRQHGPADLYEADFGDFLRNLRPRQHAAVGRLGALGQFQFDHLDLVQVGALGERFGIEPAAALAAAEITRADLPDQIAVVLRMVWADAAFAGVMGKAAEFGALVQRHDRIGAQGAETHRGNVEPRGAVGLFALPAAELHAAVAFLEMRGPERVLQATITVFEQIPLRAERNRVGHVLGAGIDDIAAFAAERSFVQVVGDEVLPDFGAERLQQIAEIGQHRIVPAQVAGAEEILPGAHNRPDQQQQEQHELQGRRAGRGPGQGNLVHAQQQPEQAQRHEQEGDQQVGAGDGCHHCCFLMGLNKYLDLFPDLSSPLTARTG